ncbi:MAG TPA: VWA domain-containing protein [Kofleriaceae bacterium]|nr:VWA domain-containing protein [Kofleriaceae bacterium]
MICCEDGVSREGGAVSDPTDDPREREALLRWRLALGAGAEQADRSLGLDQLGEAAGAVGLEPGRLGELDDALGFVYDERRSGGAGSRPNLPRWLGALREFFRHDVVALVQKDAIERRGLTQLLFEPETLRLLDRNVDLVATIVAARQLVPDAALEIARRIVREVVDDLRRVLESEVRSAVYGALRRNQHSPIRLARNIDWRRTITRNLRGWDRARRVLVPERIHFFANQRRRHEWDVALLIDQSGSMARSVVYGAVMAAIFASLDVLRTRLLFFDTEIVDATSLLADPVEVLFSTQLGGGTDIHRAVAYAQEHFVERPERTLFVLISDLFEGGDAAGLVARMRQLVDSRVKTLCLLALSDEGRPAFDHELAAELQAIGVPCFGCTPRLLIDVLARVLKGQDLAPLLAEAR